ncbi:MAG: hypothetical protein ACRELA_24730 [Candidatus Rokuibacteriota bacterium]
MRVGIVGLAGLAFVVSGSVLMITRRCRSRPSYPPDTPGLAIVRCPIHGIAYDRERESCPQCARQP